MKAKSWVTGTHFQNCMQGKLTLSTSPTCLCAPSSALAAYPMFRRTSVFVLAFSRASRWNSIVANVPSILLSCSSYLEDDDFTTLMVYVEV